MNVTCEKLIFSNTLKERFEIIAYFVSEFKLDKQLLSELLEGIGSLCEKLRNGLELPEEDLSGAVKKSLQELDKCQVCIKASLEVLDLQSNLLLNLKSDACGKGVQISEEQTADIEQAKQSLHELREDFVQLGALIQIEKGIFHNCFPSHKTIS